MNPTSIIAVLSLALCSAIPLQAQEMNKELSDMATKLAASIKENGQKKATVMDFTDLDEKPIALGKYIADRLTVNLVMIKTGFSVLDRAHLKKILAEHKLTATGLINPENAKKLGQFAGVDAIVVGKITPLGQQVSVTAQIITTEGADVVGSAVAEFRSNEAIEKLISQPLEQTKGTAGDAEEKEDKIKVSKTLGDLRVDIKSLIVAKRDFLMTLDLVNLNQKKSIWVAVNTDMGTNVKGGITDESGAEFMTNFREVSGLTVTAQQHGGFFHATEIPRADTLPVTIRFFSVGGNAATAGSCRFQMEFLTGYNFDGSFGQAKVNNLVTKIKAD